MGDGAGQTGNGRGGGAVRGEGRVSEILDAARRCFARDGYHGTSIKAIAAEAEIRSPSILHYHFPSKEAIFLAVMRDTLGALTERATELALRAPQGPRGLGAIDAFFALIDQERDLAPLMLECMAMGLREDASRDALSEILRALEDQVAEAIRRLLGNAADSLPIERHTLAATLIDLLSGHAIRIALSRSGGATAVDAERRGIRTLLGLVRPVLDAARADAAPAEPHLPRRSTNNHEI